MWWRNGATAKVIMNERGVAWRLADEIRKEPWQSIESVGINFKEPGVFEWEGCRQLGSSTGEQERHIPFPFLSPEVYGKKTCTKALHSWALPEVQRQQMARLYLEQERWRDIQKKLLKRRIWLLIHPMLQMAQWKRFGR